MHLDPVFALSIRLGFAVLFGSALLHKACNWTTFELTLQKYLLGAGAVRASLIRLLALVVVTCEFAVVALCVWPSHGEFTAAAISAVLLAYGAAILINLLHGNVLLDCGCTWGQARQPLSYGLVARNIGLAMVASPLVIPVAARSLGVMDGLAVVAAVLVAGILYLTLDVLLALDAPIVRRAR